MTERAALEPAWLLHRRAFRESSLLLEVLTRDHGRIGLVARGARGGRGSRGRSLQAFVPLLLGWSRRGELGTLGACEPAGPALRLEGDRLWSGFYVNELLIRLTARDDTGIELFELYGQVLEQLGGPESPAVVLRGFEWRLLDALGFGFSPAHTAAGEAVVATGRYVWRAGVGIVPAGAGSTGAVPGAALLALSSAPLAPPVGQCRPLLAAALDERLAGPPLRTPAMLRELRGLSQSTAD